MSKAYRIRPDGSTELLDRIRVRNEEHDLRFLLEKNRDLLAAEQIRPKGPRRRFFAGREVAVRQGSGLEAQLRKLEPDREQWGLSLDTLLVLRKSVGLAR